MYPVPRWAVAVEDLLTDVMNGTATMETLDLIDTLSESIREGSDCPIGYEAGAMVHKSLRDCHEDYEEHAVRDAVPATIHSLYLAFLSVLHMLISLDISH